MLARRTSIAIVICSIFLASIDARADETHCPIPSGASSSLGAHAARDRLRFIRSTLADQAKRASLWSDAWSAFGLVVAGESTVLATLERSDPHQRIVWLANGLPAIGFPALIAIDPMKVMADDRELENLVRNDPSEINLCASLARAEILFAEDAADEKKKTSVFSHVLCVLANIASSAVIVMGTGEWGSAITNFIGGEAVSEFDLYTLPTGAASAIDRYRAADLTLPSSAQLVSRGLNFSFSW